jgi:pimeloyl-ACP methyl ester carboxylesterase
MTTSGTVSARTRFLHAGTETYAYRRFGGGPARPLLFLQHFMGTFDNWDPSVADPLASGREVILFDNAGVGRSTGTVPGTVDAMAAHVLAFLDGVGMATCDVLGFSLGGMVAQQIALKRPSTLRGYARLQRISFAPTDSSQIHQPTLVVNGVHDEMIPVSNSYALGEHLPNAVLADVSRLRVGKARRSPNTSATASPRADPSNGTDM